MKKRQSLTINQKKLILNYYKETIDEGKKLPLKELLEWIKSKYNVIVGRSTVANMLKNRESIQKETQMNSKKIRRVKYPAFEKEIVKFIVENENRMYQGTVLTDKMILEQAKYLKTIHNIGERDLKLSEDWLRKLRNRNCLQNYKNNSNYILKSDKIDNNSTNQNQETLKIENIQYITKSFVSDSKKVIETTNGQNNELSIEKIKNKNIHETNLINMKQIITPNCIISTTEAIDMIIKLQSYFIFKTGDKESKEGISLDNILETLYTFKKQEVEQESYI